jgi:nucleotide-binding universal stress UspA family protein
MFRHLVVPIDGSPMSLGALPVAIRIAKEVAGRITVVGVYDLDDATPVRRAVEREFDRLGPATIEPCRLVLSNEPAAEVIAEIAASTPDALVVISSHGHGRSAALLGSTTDHVLRLIGGPLVVVGPNCDVDRAGPLAGPFVVPLDGSRRAERILPVAAAWCVELGATPWLVQCVPPSSSSTWKARYLAPLARDVRRLTNTTVQYEALEYDHPAQSIVEFAQLTGAPLIFMSTHGRTGLARLRSGSVAAEVLRKAPCPVVLMRPDGLETTSECDGQTTPHSVRVPEPSSDVPVAEAVS